MWEAAQLLQTSVAAQSPRRCASLNFSEPWPRYPSNMDCLFTSPAIKVALMSPMQHIICAPSDAHHGSRHVQRARRALAPPLCFLAADIVVAKRKVKNDV